MNSIAFKAFCAPLRLSLIALILGAASFSWAQAPSAPAPQEDDATAEAAEEAVIQEEELDSEPIFEIIRIDLNLFGGYLWGAEYMSLPDILDPDQTFDRGANQIVDFSGSSQEFLRAPTKKIEAGPAIGGSASFYLGENFGMQLFGAYSLNKAKLLGHTDDNPTRREIDESDVEVFRGGANIIYHLGREVKWPTRPFVILGFGGVLNQFPAVEDVSAMYFMYGGGVSGPLFGNFRFEVGTNFTLYSWETDEIALDAVITLPSVYAGVTWRYNVPPSHGGDEKPVGLGR
jgi:hypothetical protein